MHSAIQRWRQLPPQFWLFAIAVCLTAWQFVLVGRITDDSNRQTVDLLFWLGVLMLLWQKRHRLNLESDRLSTGAGLLLLGLLFYKCITLFWFESLPLRLIPVFAPLGLALLASGWRGLRQYWREFIILSLLLIPLDKLDRFLEFQTPFNKITAAFSSFLLHYIGFNIARSGAILDLGDGRSVFVAYECTGGQIILLLTKISLLFVLLFPLTWRWRALMLSLPTGLGFIIGGIRVCLLAAVVDNEELFGFWHGPPGNQIFSLVSMLLYGAWCYHVHESVVLPLEEKLANTQGVPTASATAASAATATGAEPGADLAALQLTPAMAGGGEPEITTGGPSARPPQDEARSPEPQLDIAPKRAPRPLLIFVGSVIAVLTAYTFLVPTAGGRSHPPLDLPERIEWSGNWQFQASEALPVDVELTEERFERVRSARSYQYQNGQNGSAPGTTATVELRYVTGSLGDIDGLLYAREIDADSVGNRQIRELPGIGSYRLFTTDGKAYLTSCLNASGPSTTNSGEFLAVRKQHDPMAARLGPWLLGRDSLRDRRCLWVLLSVPLASPKADPSATYRQLEGLWQVGYADWQAEIARS